VLIKTLENTEAAIKNGKSRETSNLGRQTKQKYNTICVGHHYKLPNTNNVNKTCVLLQTIWGKDEPHIVLHIHELLCCSVIHISLFVC
jgi:hypothetical protein